MVFPCLDKRRWFAPALAGLALCLGGERALADEARQEASFRLELDLERGRLRGEGTIAFVHSGAQPLSRVALVLYPRRFRALDREITDLTHRRYYARWFSEGDLRLTRLALEGRALAQREAELPAGMPEGTTVWVDLPRPLAPGERAALEVAFVLTIPKRLGSFGRDRGRVVLDGGFLPYVAASPGGPPQRTRYDLTLTCPAARQLVLGPLLLRSGERARWTGFAPFLAAGDLAPLLYEPPDAATPSVRVIAAAGDERAGRMARVARQAADALAEFLPRSAARGHVTLVRAPLRDRFTQVTDEVVLVSDRFARVFPLLEPFHELELGRAVIQSLVRQRLAGLELGPDRDWVCEAVSWVVARQWGSARRGLQAQQIRRALEFMSFIPAIDRIVRAPRFPGSDLFFGRFYEPQDAVPDAFPRALSRRARGRVPAEKLRDKIGDEALLALVRALLHHERDDLRVAAAAASGEDLGDFFALWLSGDGLRAPQENLSFGAIETLAALPGGGERVSVEVLRTGDPRIGAVGEPVDVAAVDSAGRSVRARWDGRGGAGTVILDHHGGLFDPLEIDPDQRIHQTSEGDDTYPRVPIKVLLNRLRVRLDLNGGNRNEAAVGFTLVPFLDYRHQFTVDAFYEQDERGLVLGYGRGFGWSIDERTLGASLGGQLTGTRVTQGVLRDRTLLQETQGDLFSLGLGGGLDTRIFRADPSWGLALGGHYEVADKSLVGDFRFHRFNGRAALLYSPLRGTTLGMEVVVGQIVGNRIPTQRLFDAGGENSVRGVRTSTFVDRALVAVRGELRQFLWEDLDVNLLWLFYLRRVQAVLFLDAGDVGRDLDAVVRARTDWKWGTGAGIRVWADTLGVTNLVLRFDVGFRIDETRDYGPQYYLGVGQSF